MLQYDAVIIGSGQGGTPLSKKLAKAGWKTALIEEKFIGGTCVNVGCTPTKAVVASARMAYLASKSKELGIEVPAYRVDFSAIINRKNQIVQEFRNGSKDSLEKTENLTLYFGRAAFSGQKEITISLNNGGVANVTAPYIFIDTGTTTSIPEIKGIESIPYLTSSSILDLNEIPEHLLIVGANYIACEFGQMFKRFGSKVTMLERSERFLPKEDEDVANCLRDILTEEGLSIQTKTFISEISQQGSTIHASIVRNGRETIVNCSHLLIAAGRTPQTTALALYKTGVETDERHYIKVDDKLETTQPGIFAIGDVTGGPAFTHISYNDFVVISSNLLQNSNATTAGRQVPYTMFTDPQLARIGLSEEEAKKKGLHYKTTTLSMQSVARAIETGETKGLIKAIVDADSKQILGAAVIGEQGGEIMSLLQMAMAGHIPYDQLSYMIFAHPLYAESLNNLFSKIDG